MADTNNHRIVVFKNNDTEADLIGFSPTGNKNVTINDSKVTAQLVFKGLTTPTQMAFLGSNDILVLDAERGKGMVERIVNGEKLKEPLLSVDLVSGCMCGIDISRNVNASTQDQQRRRWLFNFSPFTILSTIPTPLSI